MPQNPDDLTDDELLALDDREPLIMKLTDSERARRNALKMREFTATPDGPEGSALGRFASGAWQNLNPITMAKGVAGAVRHPIDTSGVLLKAQLAELLKARDDLKAGRYSEMLGHGAAGILPILGPAASAAGEHIAETGDIAGGIGQGAGLIAPFAAKPVVRGVRSAASAGLRGVRALPKGADALNAIAELADRSSRARMVEQIAPKVGPNKLRFGGAADDVAGALAREPGLGAFSREGLHQKVLAKFEDATQALDAAADARNTGQAFDTTAVLAELRKARQALVAETVEGTGMKQQQILVNGKHVTTWTKGTGPIGKNVEPAPNLPQLAVLDKVISEVAQLGPMARYESLRRIRQAWDSVAKQIYTPSVATDAMKLKGEGIAASKATGVLRDQLATMDTGTATANARYSMLKAAKDVLDAAEETERVRPKVGRRVVARATGAMLGGSQGGLTGAGIGVLLASVVERAAEAAPTLQIQIARKLATAADLLRQGRATQAQAVVQQAQGLLGTVRRTTTRTAAPIGQALDPLPMAAEDRRETPAITGRR